MTEPEPVPPSGSSPLAVGAVLIALLAVLVGVLVATGEQNQQVAAGSTSEPGPTTTPETTSATRFVTPSFPGSSGLIPASLAQRAEAFLVLYDSGTPDADDEVVLVSADGVEVGRGPADGWYLYHPDRGAVLVPHPGGWAVTEAPAGGDRVPGCDAVHEAGGLRAAVCGEEQRTEEIRLVGTDGRGRLLSGPANEFGGHWRWAIPSPDGRWVLAQWSGECEVPVAYLIDVANGERREAGGSDVESMGIGWTPDGWAVVGLWPGACGAADRPGTYLVDPDTGTRRRVHAYWQGALVTAP